MLVRSGQFKSVFEQGRKFPSRFLVVYIRPNGLEQSRLGFVVSRKVGNAVTRNRIRRRLRVIFRKLLSENDQRCDIVVVARGAASEAEYADFDRTISRIFAGPGNEKILNTDNKTV